jgi:hypothetical protein
VGRAEHQADDRRCVYSWYKVTQHWKTKVMDITLHNWIGFRREGTRTKYNSATGNISLSVVPNRIHLFYYKHYSSRRIECMVRNLIHRVEETLQGFFHNAANTDPLLYCEGRYPKGTDFFFLRLR